VAGTWMPSGQTASPSMLTILGLALRRGSGLPRNRKRGFKNTPYLSDHDHQAFVAYWPSRHFAAPQQLARFWSEADFNSGRSQNQIGFADPRNIPATPARPLTGQG
jgi:hypothetical protein